MATIHAHTDGQTTNKNQARKVALAGLIGSSLEWYDMFLYGVAAALVFNKIMFAPANPAAGAIAAFGTYAIGFLVRPLGGIIFGVLGDRIGRKKVLIITLMLMGGATTCIGLVPNYAAIGIFAPILLILLRAIQGLGAGAEFAGASVLIVESSSSSRRGFAGSLPASGVFVGTALSSGAFALVSMLPSPEFLSWGWRLPFLASVIIVIVALIIRLRVNESPIFNRVAAKGVEKAPIREVIRTSKRELFVLMGAQAASNGVGAIFQVFVVTYLVTVTKITAPVATTAVVIGAVVTIFTGPMFGALSDRIGRKPVLLTGSIFSAVFAFPFFMLLNSSSMPVVILTITLAMSIGQSAMLAVQGSFFSELFPPRIRMTAFSLGRESVSAIVGGFTPLIAVAFLTGFGFWLVALYTIFLAVIGTIAVFLGPETYKKSLSSDQEESAKR